MRGRRVSGDLLKVQVDGAGRTVTDALNNALERALEMFPEASEVEVSDYEFEGDTVKVTTADGSMRGTINAQIGLTAWLRVNLMKPMIEQRRREF